MAAAIGLQSDSDAGALRAAAKLSKDGRTRWSGAYGADMRDVSITAAGTARLYRTRWPRRLA
jgi:hypothetical protein